MKNGAPHKRVPSEGRFLATALGLVLCLCAIVWVSRQPRSVSVAPVHFASMQELHAATLVDLNSAGVEELMRLPGIGEVLAQRIVEDRLANGPYESVEDLLRVRGIGEAKLEALRDSVCLGEKALEKAPEMQYTEIQKD